MVATDALIAPAFPSNTACSGVLYPIVYSLAENNDSRPREDSCKDLGAYLMMVYMSGLGLFFALWLTARAANPTGVAMLTEEGVQLNVASWLQASSVPTLCAMVFIPWLLYSAFPPRLRSTPEASARAARQLRALGPMSRKEWVTLDSAGDDLKMGSVPNLSKREPGRCSERLVECYVLDFFA